jgi:hypothetical protein
MTNKMNIVHTINKTGFMLCSKGVFGVHRSMQFDERFFARLMHNQRIAYLGSFSPRLLL